MSSQRERDQQPAATRTYQAPRLIKGPVLTTVTAAKGVSTIASCWVARAAFGETDLRWMIFREWMLIDAPTWFRKLYLHRGEAVGSWLKGQPAAQAVVRRLMMPAVERVLRK